MIGGATDPNPHRFQYDNIVFFAEFSGGGFASESRLTSWSFFLQTALYGGKIPDLRALLTSPTWWISVVVAGVVINLISAYLKTPLDNILTRSSRWWASRSAARKADRQRMVDEVRENARTQLMFTWHHTRQLLMTIFYLLLSMFWISAVQLTGIGANSFIIRVVTYFFASICYLLAGRSLARSGYIAGILFDATTKASDPANP